MFCFVNSSKLRLEVVLNVVNVVTELSSLKATYTCAIIINRNQATCKMNRAS